MIPRVIHQVWVGNKERPDEWMDTWKKMMPNWDYVLWTEKEIDALNMVNSHQYKSLIRDGNIAGAVDFARVEILERHGGLYVDADSICLQTLEDTKFVKGSFLAGIEYDHRVGNSIIGSVAHHPIMKHYLARLSMATVLEPSCFTIGGTLLTTCIDLHGADEDVVIAPYLTFYQKTKDLPRYRDQIFVRQKWGSTRDLYQDKK